MFRDVVAAGWERDLRIAVTFADGKTGMVDLARYADRGGVFQRFRDPAFARAFRINQELGTLEWDGGIDIAPETLYADATGSPLPDWMERDASPSHPSA